MLLSVLRSILKREQSGEKTSIAIEVCIHLNRNILRVGIEEWLGAESFFRLDLLYFSHML